MPQPFIPIDDQSLSQKDCKMDSVAQLGNSPLSEAILHDEQSSFLIANQTEEALQGKPVEKPSSPDLPISDDVTEIGEAPDGGIDAWMAVFASFMIHFLGLGAFYSFGVWASYYIKTGLAPLSVISFIGSVSAFFLLGLGVFSGRLAEKFGFRFMIVIGNVILTLGLLLASFSSQVWELMLTQGLLFGVGMSIAYFPAVSLPSQWFEKKRGLATGIAVSGSGIGGLVMSILTQKMIDGMGFSWTMRVTALVVFVGIMAVLPFVKTRLPPAPQSKTDWTVFKDSRFLLLLATGFFATFSNLVPVYYLPAYAIDIVGVSSTDAAVLLSIYNGASAVGRIIIGIGADTIVGRLNSLLLCTLVSAFSMLFIWTFSYSYAMLVVFCVVNGFVCGGYISLFPVVVGRIFGVKRLPSLVGTLMSISAIANLSGTPLAGVVRDSLGYKGVTVFSGVLTLLSFVFAIIVRFMEEPSLFSVV
ncbi:major facilitator superfamily domain-containing protein [Chytriomyces sp. MP71]|nr:major facilitator superfamily domain-containing protein [Chytriomyces sp. MP71]